MKKIFALLFCLLIATSAFSQTRVTVQGYAESPEYIFGSSTAYDTLKGGSGIDTLRAVVRVGDSHYFTLFLDVVSYGSETLDTGVDSVGFGIYYALNHSSGAAVSSGSNYNYWEVGDTAPQLVTTWTLADTCNGGKHYVKLNYPADKALSVNATAEILLISTADNDTCGIKGILFKGK